MFAATLFVSSATGTAYAVSMPVETPASSAVTTEPPQVLVWNPDRAFPANTVVRDGYTATSVDELAAIHTADTLAAEAAARDAAQVMTASSRARVVVAPPQTTYSGAAVVEYASQFVGVVKYGPGASPDTTFACDGLTQWVYGQFGIQLPRTVTAQQQLGTPISQSDATAGDLVVWPGSHIGIYDGAGGVIHAPMPGRFVEHKTSLWGNPTFIRL
jgi:cell wall-associated NlpC family hydrolase